MANEKKVESESKAKTLVLERKPFKGKDGKEMFSYFVSGKAYGRDIRADFIAKDNGGYEVLDILFSISTDVKLIIGEEEMTNENGKTMKYATYEAQVVDSNGIVVPCKIKPQRDSDKSLLTMLLMTA